MTPIQPADGAPRTNPSRAAWRSRVLAGLLVAGAASPLTAFASEWIQVPISGPVSSTMLKDENGDPRVLEPKCAGAPQRDSTSATGLSRTDEQYSFFVRPGDPRRVVFVADGGGACWDAETCIGSAIGAFPGFGSTYDPVVDETPEDLANLGGIADIANPANPYRNFTQVFLPYCSGDIHWGSRDTEYTLELPEQPPLTWTIHHRGADNFLAALEYLKANGRSEFGVDLRRAVNVSVTGASAGGYGAQLVFPYVAEMSWLFARLTLISDSAVGVITPEFYAKAIYNASDRGSESWGVLKNLPPFVRGLNEGLFAQRASVPSLLVPGVFAALARYKPFARFSSLTTNLDLVQVGFFALQKEIDPRDAQALVEAGLEWYLTASLSLNLTAFLPNYRFIIEDGTDHVFIVFDDRTYEPGETGVVVADFIRAQITRGRRGWNSADAGPPSFSTF